jgi:hypothetical protein
MGTGWFATEKGGALVVLACGPLPDWKDRRIVANFALRRCNSQALREALSGYRALGGPRPETRYRMPYCRMHVPDRLFGGLSTIQCAVTECVRLAGRAFTFVPATANPMAQAADMPSQDAPSQLLGEIMKRTFDVADATSGGAFSNQAGEVEKLRDARAAPGVQTQVEGGTPLSAQAGNGSASAQLTSAPVLQAASSASSAVGSMGNGTDADLVKLSERAERGDAQAQARLGRMCRLGDGVARDWKQAFEWLGKAARQGDADAQCQLGLMYRKGEGMEKDLKQAFEWFIKAAQQGDLRA